MDFPVGNDLINQKGHPVGEDEGEEIFQNKLKTDADLREEGKMKALNEGGSGSEGDAQDEQKTNEKNHGKVYGFPSDEAPPFLNLKDYIQGDP